MDTNSVVEVKCGGQVMVREEVWSIVHRLLLRRELKMQSTRDLEILVDGKKQVIPTDD